MLLPGELCEESSEVVAHQPSSLNWNNRKATGFCQFLQTSANIVHFCKIANHGLYYQVTQTGSSWPNFSFITHKSEISYLPFHSTFMLMKCCILLNKMVKVWINWVFDWWFCYALNVIFGRKLNRACILLIRHSRFFLCMRIDAAAIWFSAATMRDLSATIMRFMRTYIYLARP